MKNEKERSKGIKNFFGRNFLVIDWSITLIMINKMIITMEIFMYNKSSWGL